MNENNIFTQTYNQRNKSFTTKITDPHRIQKSFHTRDKTITQDTFNKTNVHQRISINKVTNLDRINTNNDLARIKEY